MAGGRTTTLTTIAAIGWLTSCIGPVPKSRPDALDKISGTEDWAVNKADLDAEWQQWQQARSAWRAALREARLQRVRNRRVVLLIKRATILDNSVDQLRFDSKRSKKKRRRRSRRRRRR